jgi:hypothetical protein
MLAKAADVLHLDGVEAVRVGFLLPDPSMRHLHHCTCQACDLQIHKSRSETQNPDAEATRPESRRAHKPAAVRTAVDPPVEASLQEALRFVPSVGEQQNGLLSDERAPQASTDTFSGHLELPTAQASVAATYRSTGLEQALHGDLKGYDPVSGGPHAGAVGPGATAMAEDTANLQLDRPQAECPPAVATSEDTAGKLSMAFEGPPLPSESSNAAHLASPPVPARPMTAKKAPPLTNWRAPPTQRGRLRPPTNQSNPLGGTHGVHVYREDGVIDDEDMFDIVQAAQPTPQQTEQQHCGILVSEMNKAKDSAEDAQVTPDGEQEASVESGINLGRSKRARKRTSARVETSLKRETVEALVQSIGSLASSMDYLQVRMALLWCQHGGLCTHISGAHQCRRTKRICRRSCSCGVQKAQYGGSGLLRS